MRAAFLDAFAAYRDSLDLVAIEAALVSGSIPDLERAVRLTEAENLMLRAGGVSGAIGKTVDASGMASARLMMSAGINAGFSVNDPNVVMFQIMRSSELVAGVSSEIRDTLRGILATASRSGYTTSTQARVIRDYITLPPSWAGAPVRMEAELLAGDRGVFRRLLADPTLSPRERRVQEIMLRREIAERYANGTNTAAWAQRTAQDYAENLLNRRAQNIARTETLRAGNWATRESWRQAVRDGVLPQTVLKVWLVTPDDRLEHEMVPSMNPGGRKLDEYFETPEGPCMEPPSRTNCRCGMGLTFPGLSGVL